MNTTPHSASAICCGIRNNWTGSPPTWTGGWRPLPDVAARPGAHVIERVATTLERHRMVWEGARVAAAVSGGADSMALLDALCELGPRWKLDLGVAHLDHGLRGTASRGDAAFVEQEARRRGLPFHGARIEQPLSANVEQNARRARLALFARLRESGWDRVATGHTASDQAETVLFRLLRGTGGGGLAGIRPVTRAGLIRPLLELTGAEVREWARGRGLTWREDASNQDVSLTRNLIRHSVLPALEGAGFPHATRRLEQLARWAQEDEAYWEAEIRRLAERELRPEAGGWSAAAAGLAALPAAAASRLVRYACELVRGDLQRLDRRHVEAVLALARSRAGAGAVTLPGVVVERSFGRLHWSPSGTQLLHFHYTVGPGDGVELPDTIVRLELAESVVGVECVYNGDVSRLDWELLGGPLVLRDWQPGDRFRPIGHSADRKLSDLLQESRVPRWERAGWPVLAKGGSLVWSRRFGPSAEYAASPASSRVLRVIERPAGVDGGTSVSGPAVTREV
ncbi:MAG: tRNA lysidine(34) synthetase TilS [Bryobacterales bacterium]|nr:tRNA lysidine(34) synthetase TilS [Bryobacterales bacterium]